MKHLASEVRDLPTGAAVSSSGIFTWQPGPGYEFAIVGTNGEGIKTRQSRLLQVAVGQS